MKKQDQKRTRRKFSNTDKAEIFKEVYHDKNSPDSVCKKHAIAPALFYKWSRSIWNNIDKLFDPNSEFIPQFSEEFHEPVTTAEVVKEVKTEEIVTVHDVEIQDNLKIVELETELGAKNYMINYVMTELVDLKIENKGLITKMNT